MLPIKVCLWALLALVAFMPAFATLNPALFSSIFAVFLLALGLPALVGFRLWTATKSRPLATDHKTAFLLGVTFIGVQATALLRGFLWSTSPDVRAACSNMIVYLLMGVCAVVAVKIITARTSVRMDPFAVTVNVLGLYCAANMVLWLFGVGGSIYFGATEEDAKLLSWFGISTNRVFFPMAWGVNNFGTVAGVTLAAGFVRYSQTKRAKDAVLLVVIPLVCCLLTDSRAALLWACVAAFAAVKAPKMSVKALFVFWILGAVAVIFADVMPTFSFGARDSGGSTFTGREIIWAAGVAEMVNFKPEHIFGYGQFGQFESGAYLLFEMLFKGFADRPELISLHNAYLQVALDSGYVGLATLMMFLISAFRALSRNAMQLRGSYTGGFAALMFLTGAGLTEVTLSLYQPWILLLLIAIVAMLRQRGAVALPQAQHMMNAAARS